jgi:acetylornithine deacetylase/succinyl-diaminopimelate desuccinylase-like protein
MKLEETLNRLDQTQNESLSRLSELLKFKSISTNSKYKPDCIETAKWLVAELNDIGFNSSLRETTGNPMVVAHSNKSKGNFLFLRTL